MTRRVLKFGGTSVGSSEAIRQAGSIIGQELSGGGLVVVSALSGTTDRILEAVACAARGDRTQAKLLHQALWQRHLAVAQELDLLVSLEPSWSPLFERLGGMLEGMGLLWEATPRAQDGALATGETLSAQLMTAWLRRQGLPARFVDVREVLKTDGRHGRARPLLPIPEERIQSWGEALDRGDILVTQGFLGQGPQGATTTLGRGGSDTSATLLGEALDADEVQIWTDVDGVLSADPSLVKAARPIAAMTFEEAAALSAFGAKVLHADSLAPARRAGFPVVVANTRRPEASRTRIQEQAAAREPGSITSVAYKEGLTCLRFGPGGDWEGLHDAVQRLQQAGATRFGLVETPEGSLVALRTETPAAQQVVQALAAEGVAVESGWAVVAVVGAGLKDDPTACQRLLGSLEQEVLGGLLSIGTGLSFAFLVREHRLESLIPALHEAFVLEASGV